MPGSDSTASANHDTENSEAMRLVSVSRKIVVLDSAHRLCRACNTFLPSFLNHDQAPAFVVGIEKFRLASLSTVTVSGPDWPTDF